MHVPLATSKAAPTRAWRTVPPEPLSHQVLRGLLLSLKVDDALRECYVIRLFVQHKQG